MSWKYVMMPGLADMTFPIIFPENLVHADVAKALSDLPGMADADVASAGTVDGLVVVSTSGESETLGVKSQEQDASLINLNPYTKGLPLAGLETKMELKVLEVSIRMLQERVKLLKSLSGE